MKKYIYLPILLGFLLMPSLTFAGNGDFIKIYITSQPFDHDSPWQKKSISKTVACGCVLPGNRILTTAYALSDHVMIELVRPGESVKYPARVLVKDYHTGLALITAEDPSFFNGIHPVSLAEDQNITGKYAVIRKWDRLGAIREFRAMAIKSSIRIYQPNCPVLMHVMTTTMKSGGSGEPVYIDGKLTGICTGLDNRSKTLYVISNTTIRRLLKDAADGVYEGVPYFWMDYVALKGNTNLRDYLGIKKEETGILICEIPPTSSGSDVLRKEDVILSIDGRKISDNGMYRDPHYGLLNFYGLINMEKAVGDKVSMEIMRRGKKMKVDFTLKKMNYNHFVVPLLTYDRQPHYTIYGGLIFQELTLGFLQTWGKNWKKKGNDRFLFYYSSEKHTTRSDSMRYVVLNRILPSPCNKGYEQKKNLMLEAVNGTRVNNIPHFKKLLDNAKGEHIVFSFRGGTSIVLNREEVRRERKKIARTYNITSDSYTGD